MASLADAAKRYNLVESSTKIGLATLASITSMLPTFRRTSAFNIERINLSQASESFLKIRQMFSEMINLFNGINKEEEKRSILLERERNEREEDRLEKITARIIRKDAIEEEPQSTNMFGRIIQAVSHFFRLVGSGIFRLFRTLAEAILAMVRYVGRLISIIIRVLRALRFLRGVPGVGRALRAAFGIAGAVALERLLDRPNFEEEANTLNEYLEREFSRPLGRISGQSTRTEIRPNDPGIPVRIPQGIPGTASEAISFFQQNGYTREQSIGIVSNLIAESNLNPTIRGDNGNSHGIAQWNNAGGRRNRVEQFLGRSVLESSFQDQLRAVAWELSSGGPEASAGNALRATSTAEDAAEIIARRYERPRHIERDVSIRRGIAQRLINENGGNRQSENNTQPTNPNASPQTGTGSLPGGNQSSNMQPSNNPNASPQTGTGSLPGRNQSSNMQPSNNPHSGRRLIAAGSGNGGNEHVAVFLLPVRMYV